MRFKNMTVLITGASRGIGAETAKLFAKEGAVVIINYCSDKQSAEKVLSEINNNGIIIQANISKPDDVNRMFDTISEKYGRLDILVNNAGIVSVKPFMDLTAEDWDRTYKVNMRGMFLCTQSALKLMKKGSIVNISSIRGLADHGRPPIMDYSTSKAAVISFTKTLAKEVAPNIRVNCIAPGMTNTSLVKKQTKEMLEKFINDIYLKRLIEPQEVAKAILFLASDEASAITGVVLPVDGGQSLGR
ncbi:MAG: glucose 1-dehydrogenase [Candidatus Aenigmatarchaeota archaeon]